MTQTNLPSSTKGKKSIGIADVNRTAEKPQLQMEDNAGSHRAVEARIKAKRSLRENERAKRKITTTKGQECEICFEHKTWSNFPSKGSHLAIHRICQECIRCFLSMRVGDDGATRIRCPGSECQAYLGIEDMKSYLVKEILSKYEERTLHESLESDLTFLWCTNNKCSAGQFVLDADSAPISTCAACGDKSCFSCRSPAHSGKTCKENIEEGRLREKTHIQELASRKWLKKFTKTCYSCKRLCQKVDGCDHIVCRCGAEWCWACGVEYSEIRRHDNSFHLTTCPHYSANVALTESED